ncbi:hypothetical protein EIJ81_01015 (plasmid) [Aliivibrio salmonicida]|uniref:hypothetical protein n=1 Tax=Aliivibrio salmonicida TaxID=40269 RepID=UPI000F71C3AE|nr:hypothetical protein [Aliivibrio salmonicida]AZL83480.1 hypothetical protein EIJ81_01015 [Aliivibrio salmonicida]
MPFRSLDPTAFKNGDRISAKALRSLKPNSSSEQLVRPKSQHKQKSTNYLASLAEWRDLFSKAISDYLKNSGLRTKKDLEYYEQVKFFYHVSCHYPNLRYRIHASPNGGSRKGSAEGHRFNASGLSKGWPDVEVLMMRGGYGALFIEFKSQIVDYKNEQTALKEVKEHQHKHRLALLSEGYMAVVCYGAEEGVLVIDAYMAGQPMPEFILNRWG